MTLSKHKLPLECMPKSCCRVPTPQGNPSKFLELISRIPYPPFSLIHNHCISPATAKKTLKNQWSYLPFPPPHPQVTGKSTELFVLESVVRHLTGNIIDSRHLHHQCHLVYIMSLTSETVLNYLALLKIVYF